MLCCIAFGTVALERLGEAGAVNGCVLRTRVERESCVLLLRLNARAFAMTRSKRGDSIGFREECIRGEVLHLLTALLILTFAAPDARVSS